MEEITAVFFCIAIFFFWAFILLLQQLSFLKKDYKYQDKKIQEMNQEIRELRMDLVKYRYKDWDKNERLCAIEERNRK